MTTRKYKIDNIRCAMIFFVVFGHLIETVSGVKVQAIYRIIYTFHMPVFLFITGYLANFKPRKIFQSFVYPFFLFQVLYILFNRSYMQNPVGFEFTTPQWPLWYLVVCIAYYCLIPLIESERLDKKIIVIGLSCAVSLFSGFDDSIGYYMSLARFCNFLPFFVIGYYIGHGGHSRSEESILRNSKYRIGIGLTLGILLAFTCLRLVNNSRITNGVLYGSYSYPSLGHTPLIRTALIVLAFIWILFFFVVVPEKKLPIISMLGANTYPIYVMHGFFVLAIRRQNLFVYSGRGNGMLAVAVAALILLLLGNKVSMSIFYHFFTGSWIVSLYSLVKQRIIRNVCERK